MELFLGDLEIAIISLERSVDRRSAIDFEPTRWIIGVDGRDRDENFLQNQLIRFTNNMFYIPYNHQSSLKWRCRMACFLSHIKALSSTENPLLILEDDFKTTGRLNERLLVDVPEDADILFLGGFFEVKPNQEFNPKLGWNRIDTKKIKFYTTHAYIVKDPKNLLKMIRTNGKRPQTLDIYYNKHIFPKLNVYFHFNSLVTQNINFDSLIDKDTKYLSLKS